MRRRHVSKPAAAKNTAAVALAERLLANPADIKPMFRCDVFGRSGRRVERLSLARQRTSTLPEFPKSIFAAALHWYTIDPANALADGIAPENLAEIADVLFAEVPSAQRPARAGRLPLPRANHVQTARMPVVGPGAAGAHRQCPRQPDAVAAAETMRFVAAHAAPASAARGLAFGHLSQFLKACVQISSAPDGNSARIANFLVDCIEGAIEDDALEFELRILARAAYWECAGLCRARNDHEQFVSLMLAGMLLGREALAQQAMAQLCNEFPKLVSASVDAAERAITSLHRQSAGGRAILVAACLKRIDRQLAAADPQAAARARQARNNDQ